MSLLGILSDKFEHNKPTWQSQASGARDVITQLIISIVFGLSAFLSFCALRPKWTELYNARKKQSVAASTLPELPKSLFGWIPVVYRISQAEVLSSAGLDAYAFLAFFRYAIKFLSITLFFSLTVILPINWKFTGDSPLASLIPKPDNKTGHNHTHTNHTHHVRLPFLVALNTTRPGNDVRSEQPNQDYLWMYVVFVYVFTMLALYLMIAETKNIIRIRQAYLGTQSTVTDKTIRLSGIPVGMRSEDKIREFVEDLGIGRVDSIMLCKNWSRLDNLMVDRMRCLRKLEEAWIKYLGPQRSIRRGGSQRRYNGEISDGVEHEALLSQQEQEQAHVSLANNRRPTHSLRSGFLNLRWEKVDSIDHYSKQLQIMDERILELRKQDFPPTALAFVTMESTSACQMAVQAILDPTPGQFIASLAPPPVDVVWHNTYRGRDERMLRAWTIMTAIGFLSVFWAVLLLPIAGLLSIEAIDQVLPGLADILERHEILQSLVRTGLPTLTFSLLSVGVPYLYDWLSNQQGMTSQGEIELSLISKNFFFTFFNLFIVFTIWGTAASLLDFWKDLKHLLRDTTTIAFAVAQSLQRLTPFYVNLIILQGFGLLPFRLLELGSVALYPFYLISAKTPRDHAELTKAPIFSYGYYLPQTMLIFVICVVYSVLPNSWLVIVFGLIYFIIGSFIYKFQLLYAMDHRQYSTGGAWPMICNRIIVGLVVFHVAMTGFMALKNAFEQSVAVLPLIIATVWFTVYFQRTYFPLMRFIALRSIEVSVTPPIMPTPPESAWDRDTDQGRTVDTDPDTGLRYINPNLITPLESLWIRKAGHGRSYQNV